MRVLVLCLSMIWIVAAHAAGTTMDQDGKALLQKFLDPKTDRAALTAQLKPSDADIRAVYGEPLGSKLIAAYAQLYTPGTAIGPKEGQTELLVTYATTGQLKSGAAIAAAFPGGYAKVAQYIVGDVPILRFKFVKQGETLGMAYDGLIHINGRWVFMPKPWNGLEQ